MKILIIAFSDSIHTARWLANISSSKFEIHLFPSVPFRDIHPLISNVTVHQLGKSNANNSGGKYKPKASLPLYNFLENVGSKKIVRRLAIKFRYRELRRAALMHVIKTVQPDIIHTMETQQAGYLLSEVLPAFPVHRRWVHSTWGIDLHYFKNIPEHAVRLSSMLAQINFLICEGKRDTAIAESLGYKGAHLIIPSVGGGLDFDLLDALPHETNPLQRTKIIIKGYEGYERLASVALMALRKLKVQLQKYTVVVYSCSDRLLPLIEEIQAAKEFNIEVKKEMPYEDLLKLTCEARISITNNLSDGVPNTMLEAMALGAFPIQSNTAITEGWIENGKNGFLTQPENMDSIAAGVSEALANDTMVAAAALYNKKLVRDRLNKKDMQVQIEGMYKKVFNFN